MNNASLLRKQIEQIKDLKVRKRFGPEFNAWERKTKSYLERIFGKDSAQIKDFTSISYAPMVYVVGESDSYAQKDYIEGLENAEAILNSMVEELIEFDTENDTKVEDNPYIFVLNVLDKFHSIARQIKNRYDSRPTLEVNDEYDAQDLLHSILKVKFEDIRREEWTPSNASKSARMDLLLNDLGVVIEVKKTRDGLRDKELGDQLIIDIARYKSHPNCKKLICFIYDPMGYIGNPAGLASDLKKLGTGLDVDVVIKP